jgi:nicotinic acid mononucleotide adenylyltransferase
MGFDFLHRGTASSLKPPARVALFPGAWNPPTIAHVEIAKAALVWADEVVFVLPRALPHKIFEGVAFEDRADLLARLARSHHGFAAALSGEGLFSSIAHAARKQLPAGTEIGIICGRDAAERVASWDYGRAGAFDELLRDYPLLVAARGGEYEPPEQYRHRIVKLDTSASMDAVSSTELRRRAVSGEKWQDLSPPELRERIGQLYASNDIK